MLHSSLNWLKIHCFDHFPSTNWGLDWNDIKNGKQGCYHLFLSHMKIDVVGNFPMPGYNVISVFISHRDHHFTVKTVVRCKRLKRNRHLHMRGFFFFLLFIIWLLDELSSIKVQNDTL